MVGLFDRMTNRKSYISLRTKLESYVSCFFIPELYRIFFSLNTCISISHYDRPIIIGLQRKIHRKCPEKNVYSKTVPNLLLRLHFHSSSQLKES